MNYLLSFQDSRRKVPAQFTTVSWICSDRRTVFGDRSEAVSRNVQMRTQANKCTLLVALCMQVQLVYRDLKSWFTRRATPSKEHEPQLASVWDGTLSSLMKINRLTTRLSSRLTSASTLHSKISVL